MQKVNIRYLSFGFLISAVILFSFQFLSPSSDADAQTDKSSSSTEESDEAYYKQKYEELLLEVESQKIVSSSEPTAESQAESQTSAAASEEEQTAASSSEEAAPEVKEVAFTIENGEPSQSVIERLLAEGLISNTDDIENYLISGDRLTDISYGTFTLRTDMSYEEIAETITQGQQ